MAGNTSKMEARRRAREALARINEARAQRDRANVDDAATFVVAVGKSTEVDAWESERLAAFGEYVRAEANRRRADCRAEAAVAIARMQQRGETLATIAELAGLSIGKIRAMLRYAPKPDRHATSAPVRAHQYATPNAGKFQPGSMLAATRPWATQRWCSEDSVGRQSGRFS
jgi:hypothetical protein